MDHTLGTTPREHDAGRPDLARLPRAVIVYHRNGTDLHALDERSQLVVGRTDQVDITLPDPRVSRRHALLRLLPNGVRLEDLGSTNGTWVNGVRRERCLLSPGDVVVIGGAVLAIQDLEQRRQRLDTVAPASEPIVRDATSTGASARCSLPSPAMRFVSLELSRWAPTDLPVLITGETGVGKEVVAQQLHGQSPRRDRPMVCVDCGALTPQLIESTLFGHERGAFTGAERERKGIFEAADGGTILLDEVGELPPAIQAALLRVLETGRFRRVGSVVERNTNVRLVAATNRDIAAQLRSGAFRKDLFYRLSGIAISVPPLRERREDIAALARHFIAEQARRTRQHAASAISPAATRALQGWSWPGNARELRHVIQRAVILATAGTIECEHLPQQMTGADQAAPAPVAAAALRAPTLEDQLALRDLRTLVRDYEAQIIRQHLHEAGGNRSVVAQRLGISRRTLGRKLVESKQPDSK